MAQPQPQAPPRAFSPPQPTSSPATSQSAFALPPNKRVRTDGPPSQPESPYAASPYAASPTPGSNSPATVASPQYAQGATTPGGYATPYVNGQPPPTGLTLPDARAQTASPLHTPQPPLVQTPVPQYTTATMAPMPNTPNHPSPAPGVMGPPQRPADRPTKDYEYDVTDSLAGTGIDLRAEEQYMSELYSTAIDNDTRSGFPHHPPGSKATFYGAGPANQPAQPAPDQDQERMAAQAAEQAWTESSIRLAVSRGQEINDPFLLVAIMHRRADKIAKEHHIGLNLDLKNNPAIGRLRHPDQFPTPKVTVRTTPGPDATMVHTSGSYIPHDAYLADQLALLSIATKQRLRELVGDAHIVAENRQKTSHGDIPEEWQPAAAPMNAEPLGKSEAEAGTEATEPDNAAAGDTNALKRSADAASLTNGSTPAKLPKIAAYMTLTMRELARQEREWEEARLRRRQQRKDGTADSGSTTSRAGSAAPRTPGSVAPEPEKSMSKKEMKKNQALKAAEANSHANQNMTSSMFAGLGGKGNLFGKKKTGKTYDWMNVGRGGSGTSTPTKSTPGAGKGSGGGGGGGQTQPNLAMTTEGRNRLGTWREDKEKGKNIQLRDWVVVLERDGREAKALQQAYIHLDASTPR